MPTISISKASRHGQLMHPLPEEKLIDQGPWYQLVNTANPDARLIVPSSPTILSHELKEIRWYLEDYALKEPLATTRAAKAKNSLLAYGRTLALSIKWPQIIFPHERDELLVLEIQVSGDDDSQEAVWEVLEDPASWDKFTPPAVQVLRVRSQYPAVKSVDVEPDLTSLNILVVAARPDSDKDVSHRLVSRILHNKIRTASATNAKSLTLAVVRPGSWQAFCEHLSSRPVGHYQVVHFDLHGMEDSEGRSNCLCCCSICRSLLIRLLRTHLAFIKADAENPATFRPDLVSASKTAAVLAASGVKQVVLNACRSGRGIGLEQNAALAIVGAGIEVCVAMTHNIVSRAVEMYTSVLYDALVVHGIALDDAAFAARTALRHNKERISGYGDRISVDDWIVPVIYTTSGSRHKRQAPVHGRIEYKNDPNPDTFPYGREEATLHIESTLLIAKKPLLLTGHAGMGKTYLLEHLRHWWRDTGLISNVHYVQFSKQPRWNMDGLFRYLHGHFFLGKPFPGREAIVHFLKENHCLLVFDSLESVQLSNTRAKRAFHREFLYFLRSLQGGKTLVIIASRGSEDWLSEDTITYRLGSVGTIGGMQLFQSLLNDWGDENYKVAENPADGVRAFEQMVKLVDGNPVAILLLVICLLKSGMSPESFLLKLLSGAPLPELDMEPFHKYEEFRGMAQLGDIISSLDPSGLDAFLPVQILAPFWKVFPSSDAAIYTMCYSRKVHELLKGQFSKSAPAPQQYAQNLLRFIRDTGKEAGWQVPNPGGEFGSGNELLDLLQNVADRSTEGGAADPLQLPDFSIDDAYLTLDGMKLETMAEALPGLQAQVSRITDPLAQAHFLGRVPENVVPSHISSRDYLSMNPCLTILLRGHFAYRNNVLGIGKAARLAFAYYYAYRTKSFPFSYMYFNNIWATYRDELAFEFTNFLGASAMAFEHEKASKEVRLEHSILSRMVSVIHRGTGSDPSRLNIVQLLWAMAIDCNLQHESNLLAQRPSRPSFLHTIWQKLASWQVFAAAEGSRWGESEQGLYRESLLFGLRAITLQLVFQVVTAYHHLNSQKEDQYLQIAQRLVLDMIRDGIPIQQDQVYWRKLLDYYKYLANNAMKGDSSLEEMWTRRESWVKLVTDHLGVEPNPSSYKSWSELPMDLLAKHSHSARIVTPVTEARKAIREGRLDDARRIIDDALRVEIFEANGDLSNKASLLDLLADVNEKSGEWSDALKNFDEANELKNKVALSEDGRPSLDLKQSAKREHRRQQLLHRIQESEAA